MELAFLLPIAAFIALAAGLAMVLQRTGRIVAKTRELEVFKSNVKDLASRVDSSLGGAATQIDAVRRRQLDPGAIGDTLEAATDAVERYTVEARALRGPRETNVLRNAIIGELERAGRALGTVEHGTTMLLNSRPRELEAETSIKRGYLNLLHAREAIARHASEAARLPDRDQSNGVQ